MTRTSIYWLFTACVISILVFPALTQEGMFLDGVTYSAVSKNLANSYGSVWEPHYTKTVYAEFYEQPPLVFFMQAGFFAIFGDNFYTERLYCLFTLVLTIGGIVQCWRVLAEDSNESAFAWFPVLIWITIPLTSWSYKNNVLENTMNVFCVFATYFVLKSLREKKLSYLFAGSVFVSLAFFSKGFTGLFPLAAPLLYGILWRNEKRSYRYGVYFIFLTLVAVLILFFVFPGLKNNINNYLNQQLLPALSNQREITTTNRFNILMHLLFELTGPILLLILITIIRGLKNFRLETRQLKKAGLFLLIAASASLPLIISLKQRRFYLSPSLPFYVLGISHLVLAYTRPFFNTLSNSILSGLKWGSIVIFISIVLYATSSFGKFSRDKNTLMDVYAISAQLPEGTIIGTTEHLSRDWVLVAYLSRVGYISLDPGNEHEFYLTTTDLAVADSILATYQVTHLKLNNYILLKKKK